MILMRFANTCAMAGLCFPLKLVGLKNVNDLKEKPRLEYSHSTVRRNFKDYAAERSSKIRTED